jgi:cysteine desulfurase/selenocysteine lyase
VTPVLFGWRETLDYLHDLGPAAIESRVTDLGGYLIERLDEIGCEVVTPRDPDRRHGLVVYTTSDDAVDVATYERFSAPEPGTKPINVTYRSLGGVGGVRVSCHFFNTREDVDELVARQERILNEVEG